MTVDQPTYKAIAARKLALRNHKFLTEWNIPENALPTDRDVLSWITTSGYLSSLEVEITESSTIELLEALHSRKWTSVEVTRAFCHRAQIAHQLVNCLSEVFFDEALKQAAELDDYLDRTGNLKGPLHGLPMSLKDNFNVRGQPTTLGIVNFCFNPPKFEEDSALVELLRNAGAVFYVKTNTPVAMMMPETNNHIYGNTTNPMNRLLSCGGSSGGECALVKLKGTPWGVGSDIGGSIRIPASFQNLYGLRPTFGRFPTYGTRSGLPGFESINSVNGPITRTLDDMETYCKIVLDAAPHDYDPKVSERPWNPVEISPKLNVAVVVDDGYVRPTPPVRRGMQIVIEALKKDGHDVIEWDASEHVEMAAAVGQFFLSDGGKHILEQTQATGEPLFSYMKPYGHAKMKTVAELWDMQADRTALCKKFLQNWVNTAARTKDGRQIDCIIMPVTSNAGTPNDKFPNYVGYTSIVNLVDWPSLTFPVTRADKNIDVEDTECSDHSEVDRKVWEDYVAEEVHGGAVAMQLVGRRFQEEKVLAMVRKVASLIEYEERK